MSMTEDRLRATARAVADAMPDYTVPGLDLSRVQARRPGRYRRPSFPRMASAVAAAVAVIAVAGTSVAVWGGGHPARPAAGSSLLDRVPRYYMALIPAGPRALTHAVIRDTLTGATVATIRPPAPFNTFSTPAAAPDDRTFVLEAQYQPGNSRPTRARIYIVHFDPARGSHELSPLPGPQIPASSNLAGLALSPNMAELAVALDIKPVQIRIYSLAGDRANRNQTPIKVWNGPTSVPGFANNALLSWARTGVLAYNWTESGKATVRLLDTRSRGGALLGSSRVALTSQAIPVSGKPFRPLSPGLLSADGTTIATVVLSRGTTFEFLEFSAQTGKLIRILDSLHVNGIMANSEWINSSGRILVGWGRPNSGARHGNGVLGVLAKGRFVPIPGAPSIHSSGMIAF